ncbi:MAG: DegT/DnrJ/EryC1/StrS family aminotransferase [Planctomycetes bacterium]|nr:DegT/DnrJ/EryC1/StrS family aminotransferase [Planctomycetota bacterium]MCC7396109.1 DegT/DnrJ/EryC1/StrS family aminotransferase [Planctomycetota bacterium]
MRQSYLVFGQPLIEQPEIDEVLACLRSAWLGTGPRAAEFERRIAAYKGVPHAVGLNSCTAGLHLGCLVLGLGQGDEVITTPMTFCASVNAIVHAGATPVLADVDPVTMNIDPEQVRRRITPRTRAILPVHFAGRACDMDALMSIAKEHDLRVIEDCAHAIETEYRGQKAGAIGDLGVLSFYSTKNIVTGEGGMVLTRDPDLAKRTKMMGLHGMSADAWKRFTDDGYKHYDVEEVGFKYNLMDLQAAIGMHQITRIEAYWQRRLVIWNRYLREFADLPIGLPAPWPANERHALHLFTILVDERRCGISRDEMLMRLHRQNIGTGVHYRAIPGMSVYQRRFGWRADDCPHAKTIGDRTLSLPLSAKLTDDDVSDVINAVKQALGA